YWRSLVCAALLGLAGLPAAVAAEANMEFPRTVLDWYWSGDVETLWQHTSPTLREMVEDPEMLRGTAAEHGEMMGRELAVLDEQVFDHPDGEGWQVYLRTARHAVADEIFWVVIFSPAKREVGMIMPQSRPFIRVYFPEARLP